MYNKMVCNYENNKSIKNMEYYDLKNKKCKYIILEQSDCGKYFVTIPEKNLKEHNYIDIALCSVENKEIKQLVVLDYEIVKQGFANLKNIVEVEINKIKNTNKEMNLV